MRLSARLIALVVLGGSGLTVAAAAQPRAAPIGITRNALPQLTSSAMDFADVDGDGDLDWLLMGERRGLPFARLYLQRDSLLSPPTQGAPRPRLTYFGGSYVVLRSVRRGSAALADLNGDGLVDFMLAGLGASGSLLTDVYLTQWAESDSIRVLRKFGTDLPAIYQGALAVSPPSGGGQPRYLALCGATTTNGTESVTRLYRLVATAASTEVVFEAASLAAPDLSGCAAAWADVDGDGDPDLALSGVTEGRFHAALYRNEGGVFREAQRLRSLAYGSLDWGDHDGDGDPDLLLTGGLLDPRILRGSTTLYRNDAGHLTAVDTDLPGIVGGAARFFDMDGDARKDVVLAGGLSPLGETVIGLYRSLGAGRFAPPEAISDANLVRSLPLGSPCIPTFGDATSTLSGASPISVGVVDYNGDGDDDLVLSGTFASIRVPNERGGLIPKPDEPRTYVVKNPFVEHECVPSDYFQWRGAQPGTIE